MPGPLLDLQPVSSSARAAFLEGRNARRLPRDLRACWERVAGRVDPDLAIETDVLVQSRVAQRREALEPWLRLLPRAIESVKRELARRHHLLVFADVDAVVLHRSCEGWIADQADQAEIIDGSLWDETRKGTNAIGTTLVEQRPVAVHAEAHFASPYHGFTCYAAPVFDLRGELLGVLDATSVAARRESLGWLAVVAATQELERLVRGQMAGRGELLPLRAMERLLARFAGPAALFGPRGNLRVANPSMELASPELGRLQAEWPTVRRAISDGHASILGHHGSTVHLEPFHDGDGALLEVAVFCEAAPETVSRVSEGLPDGFSSFAGSDAVLQATVQRAKALAATELPITLLSETGTGKELLARAIHQASPRSSGPFVPLNCAALAPGLMESELFGYAPGAFTGASRDGRDGWLAQAHGGTLFLDEVADLPFTLQAALLRFLDGGAYARVGEACLRHADVRVLAATSRDLPSLVERGEFRADLYYRIGAVLFTLPPLRARTDLLAFAEQMLDRVGAEVGRCGLILGEDARELVRSHPWPGNVRQLKNALLHAAALVGSSRVVRASHFPPCDAGAAPRNAASTRDDAMRQALVRALREQHGNVSAAARVLGVARSTVYRMIDRYEIPRS